MLALFPLGPDWQFLFLLSVKDEFDGDLRSSSHGSYSWTDFARFGIVMALSAVYDRCSRSCKPLELYETSDPSGTDEMGG